MKAGKNQRGVLFTLFFTVFLDLLGLGIIIPVLAPLFLNPQHGILPFDTTFSFRTLALGLLIATYPLAQFFGAPVLGGLSDKHGRKKILLIALLGTLLGYAIFAWGVVTRNIYLLFISRALDGFTGGNIAIIQSAIADTSDTKSRQKNFGLIGMAFGLGFILGPFLGGKLADPSVVSWFTFATPFWFAAFLSALNIALVIWSFPETLLKKSDVKISAFTGLHNIKKAMSMGNVRTMFIVLFLLTLGFNFFTQFFQVYLIDKFNFTQGDIGEFFAYIGIWIAIAQGLVARLAADKIPPEKSLAYASFVLAIIFPLLLIPKNVWGIYLIGPFVALCQGLIIPSSTTIVSNLADAKSQGEILGINQSIQSLGQAIPPIIAGAIVALHRNLPIMAAGVLTIIAWLIFIYFFKVTAKEKFHEIS